MLTGMLIPNLNALVDRTMGTTVPNTGNVQVPEIAQKRTSVPTMRQIEHLAIAERLALYGNAVDAARSLRISKSSIYRKMRQYGLLRLGAAR